ncbi:ABC transporter permease [Planctobacterium marinum]|uniref:ABC transporter permease n=1 Tax=Planctobacterium marinum TaxID=1631968 RepID=UPI001E4EA9D1|nr:ABC transporter permease [Planctobacterium marinum]MCC2604643.1 ABC transporter permease [Planctobacterium marinum]
MFLHYLDLSWRSFKRTPVVSVLMVFAVAVGIGITMTSLSVYHMMSMDPIPEKSDKLFHLQLQTMEGEQTRRGSPDGLPYQMTYQDAVALSNAPIPARKVPSMKAGFSVHMNTPEVKPFIETARMTNRDFFDMFNLSFVHGGPWTLEQQDNATPVVVINEEINNRLFGGANSVGNMIYLDNRSYLVVGVMKQWKLNIKFYDVNNGAFHDAEQLFLPFSLIAPFEIDTWGNTNGWKSEETNTFQQKMRSEDLWIQFWAELNNEQEEREYGEFLMSYMQEQQKSGRFDRDQLEYALRDVLETMDYRGVVSEDNRILVGLSFMFLAVCLANILGLLLAKFLRRAPEVGVRRALGASKTQVFYQHLVEVSLLGLMGGIVGIGISQLGLWGVRLTQDYYTELATMDITMLIAAPAIAITSCVIAGLYPAWLVCGTTPATYLKTQ